MKDERVAAARVLSRVARRMYSLKKRGKTSAFKNETARIPT